ncbi:MAG TPA: choice-of-anchor P family protein [Candidatus Baltobacteraceae bacterium]|nr:choice-of-anchor P family protein [Candidatus Baltobacteraceae bacterium]
MIRSIALGVAVALLSACSAGSTTPPTASLPTSNTLPAAQPDSLTTDSTAATTDTTAATTDSTAATTPGTFGGFANGSAYAAHVTVDTGVGVHAIAGPLAPVSLGCLTGNKSAYNSVASVALKPYLVSGTAADALSASYSSTTGSQVSTSTIQSVSLLNGLIKATTVKAEANSTASAGSATSNETGSQLAGLVVAGTPISVMPAPNTKITLANLGYVVLNEVYGLSNNAVAANGTRSTAINVNMIHVYVTSANALGIAVGTQIIVASAHSAFTVPPAPFAENATAYSLYAKGYAGNLNATSGPWAIASISCNSFSDTNRLASATTPVGSLGTMVNTTSANVSSTTTTVNASSDTASVNAIHGLVTAQALDAKAKVTRSGSVFGRSASLTFTSLKVGGTSISASVAPNTRVTIANLGYAIVNDQAGSVTTAGVYEEIDAVVVHVTTANSYGLPIGATIIVGHARAGINAI